MLVILTAPLIKWAEILQAAVSKGNFEIKVIFWLFFLGNLSGPTGLIGAQGGKYIVRKNMLLCVPDFDPISNTEVPNYEPVNFCQVPYQRLDFMSGLESATGTVIQNQ